jgi:DNA-cytosine methyltransferase
LKVLSLFDGMSCLQIALQRAGIKVDTYYASEIDVPAIKVAQKNFPNTIQIGDITKLTDEQLKGLGEIDLLGGGSPCQNLSQIVAGDDEHNQGLDGEKSKLFYDYAKVLRKIKPKYFLYENVASMKDKDKNIISHELGVEPIMICSSLVSGQERERYYWTNIPGVTQPEDRKISLGEILEDQVDESYYYHLTYDWFGLDKKIVAKLHLYNYDMLQRVYNPKFKAPTLTACKGGHKQKKVWQHERVRKMTPLEYERLQTVPEGYTKGVADGHRYNMLGNGWTIDVISHILSFIK